MTPRGSQLEDERIRRAVHEAGTLLRADGADLEVIEFDAPRARVQVAVRLIDASCVDCIVAPDLLADLITAAVVREFRDEIEVVVDDPRRDPSHSGSGTGTGS